MDASISCLGTNNSYNLPALYISLPFAHNLTVLNSSTFIAAATGSRTRTIKFPNSVEIKKKKMVVASVMPPTATIGKQKAEKEGGVIKVHGPPMSTCVVRVLVVLEEMGVEYEVYPIDLAAKEQKLSSHVARNPFGQVPAIEDGDLTLFESRAITRYIIRKNKGKGPDLLREDNPEESAMVDVWMEVEAQQYNPAVYPIVYQTLVAPRRGSVPNPELIAAGEEKLAKLLDIYEERLSKTQYLAGDFFSLADLHHLPFTYYLMATPQAYLITSRPHVKDWWDRLMERPACKKVTAGMIYASQIKTEKRSGFTDGNHFEGRMVRV